MDDDNNSIDLSGKSMSELVEIFNAKAEMFDGIKPVKKFADRATAEKRVANIISRVGGVVERMPKEEIKKEAEDTITETSSATPALPENNGSVDDMATKSKSKPKANGKSTKVRAPRKPKEEGALVGKGSFRDKLLNYLQSDTHFKKQNPMSKVLVAVYGENRKDFRAPLMMVVKGLTNVLATNRTGKEIRKTRENKETCIGLYNRTDPKTA